MSGRRWIQLCIRNYRFCRNSLYKKKIHKRTAETMKVKFRYQGVGSDTKAGPFRRHLRTGLDARVLRSEYFSRAGGSILGTIVSVLIRARTHLRG